MEESVGRGHSENLLGNPSPFSQSGSKPVWWSATLTPPIADRMTEQGNEPCSEAAENGLRGGKGEGRCSSMARFARLFAVLSALAAVLMVAGASTKY